MPFLNNSSNIRISQSRLIDITVQNSNASAGTDGISSVLHQFIAARAMHDSIERENEPRCHELTRKAVQGDIMSWLCRPTHPEDAVDILWLTGAPGIGKTAVAQTIAKTCAMRGVLAASFFFSFRSQETNNYRHLIPTIAYQLAINIPDTRNFIAEIITADATVATRDFCTQLEMLLLTPLAKARGEPGHAGVLTASQWPHVLIIDGLDECKNPKEQAAILEAIHTSLQDSRLPFRIIIASRPEKEMRRYFHGAGKPITRIIRLDEDYDAEDDIELYLRSSFNTIRTINQIQGPWPLDSEIKALVSNASRQFVYATTVIDYINNDTLQQPEKRLLEVLEPSPDQSGPHPLSPLDSLYLSIFQKCSDPFQSVLAIRGVEELELNESLPSAAAFNAFMGYNRAEWTRMLDGLHSVLIIPAFDDQKSKYRIRHKTLTDFLTSGEPRAKHLHIPRKVICTTIAVKYLALFQFQERNSDPLEENLRQ
ncbi:hypothetical protein FA15DRAFT_340009 [Coprinopsis marcescibilis]|uniref:Nephrocystin 3-like N-terminal domain-containing protein n=1 Tax=Coprinopsis marcescibilis TaxID=230819 RepID=A0A5C3KZ90_COPMA|nr:hypothetical protein FA15DRAFT_340009 [Coprinopsis marcescibilis]